MYGFQAWKIQKISEDLMAEKELLKAKVASQDVELAKYRRSFGNENERTRSSSNPPPDRAITEGTKDEMEVVLAEKFRFK